MECSEGRDGDERANPSRNDSARESKGITFLRGTGGEERGAIAERSWGVFVAGVSENANSERRRRVCVCCEFRERNVGLTKRE